MSATRLIEEEYAIEGTENACFCIWVALFSMVRAECTEAIMLRKRIHFLCLGLLALAVTP